MIETWEDGLCRHGNPKYPKLKKDYCRWCMLSYRWYHLKQKLKDKLHRFSFVPKWHYFTVQYDFHDNQDGIRSLPKTQKWLGDNGFEITQFNREESHQNSHYHNYFLHAKRFGRMAPDYESLREAQREWWK